MPAGIGRGVSERSRSRRSDAKRLRSASSNPVCGCAPGANTPFQVLRCLLHCSSRRGLDTGDFSWAPPPATTARTAQTNQVKRRVFPITDPGKRSRRRYKGSCEIAIRSFLLRGRTLCFHRFIDQPAYSLGVPVIRSHFASIDKQ